MTSQKSIEEFIEKELPYSFFCSWSGGKDSCLALYRAIRKKAIPRVLLTSMTEDGERSRSHGLSLEIVQRQAQSMGIPLVTVNTSWEDYESKFLSAISGFKADGIECGVFGDIDLDVHLEWVERVCSSVGIRAYEPLWKSSRRMLLDEFVNLGFQATIIAVKLEALDESFLGRPIDQQTIADLEKAGVDASGEAGEYHTVVTDGPIFSAPIRFRADGKAVREGYGFLEIAYCQK